MSPRSAMPESGFHGDVSGVSLADLIQLNALNAVSGCVTVRHGDRTGRIFFRDGAVVHAEHGARAGEEAFCDIMEWRTGEFAVDPNVTTTRRTVQKSTQFLLMDACRTVDERRAQQGAAPSAAGAGPAARSEAPPRTSLTARARNVAGVRYAVLTDRGGACGEDRSPEAEALAGRAAYLLSMVGDRVGACLGAGEVLSVAARSRSEQLVVLAVGRGALGVLVDGSRPLAAAEQDLADLLRSRP